MNLFLSAFLPHNGNRSTCLPQTLRLVLREGSLK
jgi:hypothetical protein